MLFDIVSGPKYTPEEVQPGQNVTFSVEIKSEVSKGDQLVRIDYALSTGNNVWFQPGATRQKFVTFANEKITEAGVELRHKTKVVRHGEKRKVTQAQVTLFVTDANGDTTSKKVFMRLKK